MIWFLWHSLLLGARTPTCNGVYQVWYGFDVISITRRGGIYYFYFILDFVVIVEKYCEETKLVCTSVAASSSSSLLQCHQKRRAVLIDLKRTRNDHTKTGRIENNEYNSTKYNDNRKT